MKQQAKDELFVWHPFDVIDVPRHLLVKKAKGSKLYLQDGTIILDGISSWWVNVHGHGHPRLNKALRKQLQNLEHVLFAGFTHRPAVDLAAKLVPLLPGPMQKIFYSDNGSTAVEVAIKLAIQYWFNQGKERTAVIALEGAYHGDTFGAMAVGNRDVFSKPFVKNLFEVHYLPVPTAENLQEVLAQADTFCKKYNIAAFIYEPLVQGSAGMRMYEAAHLDVLLTFFEEKGILRIADEVMTGFGRTGTLFAGEQLKTKPDLICLSKGLTGGYLPLGATAVSANVTEAFDRKNVYKAFLHGHSFTANPLACAVALESLNILQTSQSVQQRSHITQQFNRWVEKFSDVPTFQNVRSLGTIFAFEYKSDAVSVSYFHPLRDRLYHFFLNRGILLRPLGNTVYCLPPYSTTPLQLKTIEQALDTLAASGLDG